MRWICTQKDNCVDKGPNHLKCMHKVPHERDRSCEGETCTGFAGRVSCIEVFEIELEDNLFEME
jgi:hypothetical protein